MLKLSPAKQITLSAMCIALTVLSLYAAARAANDADRLLFFYPRFLCTSCAQNKLI